MKLLLIFVHQQTGKQPSQPGLGRPGRHHDHAFLNHLETERRNSIRTRNVRLTAIRSLFSFAALRPSRARPADPAGPGDPAETVRQTHRVVPDRHRDRRADRRARPEPVGRPTGPGPDAAGRADRAPSLRADRPELRRRDPRRRRQRPLRRQRPQTPSRAPHRPGDRAASRPGSPNGPGDPTTRCSAPGPADGSAATPSPYGSTPTPPPPPNAARPCQGKRVHPHVLRHSCAMTLLQAGVDTSVIALWLGHAGVRSTDPYLHADITIKERALALTTPTDSQARPLPASRQDARLPREPVTMPTTRTRGRPCATRPRHAPRHSRGVGIGRPMRISA